MKMPEKIYNKMFAPCGMNCMVCYVHLKKKKPCLGCLNNDYNKPERCKLCNIKNCAHQRGFTYCYECSEFPCPRIKNLDKSYKKRYNTSLIENSNLVKKIGFNEFFKMEKSKWQCKKCGGIISVHGRECSECGIKYTHLYVV